MKILSINTIKNFKDYRLISNFRNIEQNIIPIEINYLIIISPYKIQEKSYKDIDLIYHQDICPFVKYVTFKLDVDICIINENIDRMLSMSYYRDLIGKCSRAHQQLYNIINNITNNFLIPLDEYPEDPLKINDPNRKWDEDESPFEILDKWKKDPSCIKKYISSIEKKTNLLNNIYHGKKIKIELPEINVNNNFYKGILQVRLAGKNFSRLSDDIFNNKIIKIEL